MKPSVGQFKDHLQEEISNNPKTSWGKKELALYIEQVYSAFLERYLED